MWSKSGIKRKKIRKTLIINVITDLKVEKMGLEPTTSWLPAKRSSQLSYIPQADGKYIN